MALFFMDILITANVMEGLHLDQSITTEASSHDGLKMALLC